MGSTQREEVFPPPPPYQPAVTESGQQYQPPAGPPPSQHSEGAPLPDAVVGPPSLAAAPPIYEPFSFSKAYARSHYANAPKWHSPPTYHIYHDSDSGTITFHIPFPSTDPPCACSNNFHCKCQRRRPAIWEASAKSLQRSRRMSVELQRLSPFSGSRQVAYEGANDGLMGSSSSLAIRGESGKMKTQMKRKAETSSFKDLDGNLVSWTKQGNRLELSNGQGMPVAILHPGSPARLELTAFAWGRMPSDEIECDFPACSLSPLYGFIFRCQDCTEQGDDSFDICEAHLATECRDHNQSHRFVRQPRPFAEYDDCVRETPLLREKDLKEERQRHELIIMTLACVLLDSRP